MKLIQFIVFILWEFNSFGQLTIVPPQIHYVSQRQFGDSDWMKVGEKLLFQQQCTTELPPEVPTGIVFFENVYHQKERFSIAVEFKDTVIVSMTFYLSAKQTTILNLIGYSEIKGNASAVKGQWTCILEKDGIQTVIVGDKKDIVVVQTLKEKEVP